MYLLAGPRTGKQLRCCQLPACRAAIRAHKIALQAQHGMWRELMHDNIQFVALQERLAQVDDAERQATQVYQR